jgi:hypothetical protein
MNGVNGPNKIVYDCMDPSPFYDSTNEPYLDDSDILELQSDETGNNDYRKYPYG